MHAFTPGWISRHFIAPALNFAQPSWAQDVLPRRSWAVRLAQCALQKFLGALDGGGQGLALRESTRDCRRQYTAGSARAHREARVAEFALTSRLGKRIPY